MNFEQIMKHPLGEITLIVHLRRGTNDDARGTQSKKALVADSLHVSKALETLKERVGDKFDELTAEQKVQFLMEVYRNTREMFENLSNRTHVMITINEREVFIHPDDISFVELKTTGIWVLIRRRS